MLILSQLDSWYEKALLNWRDGFDIFKVLYDFASIDSEHSNFLEEFDILNSIIQFVENFKNFVISQKNSISLERFKQLCDLTYIFKLFETIKVDINKVLAPSFFEWCIGSSKLIRIITHSL